MNCTICKTGEYEPGKVTVKPERGHSIVIIKEVPAQVCDNCGEYTLDETVTNTIIEKAQQAVASNAEVEVLPFLCEPLSIKVLYPIKTLRVKFL